jgi:FixJ family two-component response regulator
MRPVGPRITIVDDDDSVREALSGLLRALGYSTEAFSSPEAFLDSGTGATAQCLILDVTMPTMSGLELQRELARRQLRIPIVFVTGDPDESIRAIALEHGAVDCLFKPFSEAVLLAALDAALQ